MADEPTRLVRARTLTPGAVFHIECGGPTVACPWPGVAHDAPSHEMTVLDAELLADGTVSVIFMGDNGEQGSRAFPGYTPIRLVVREVASRG